MKAITLSDQAVKDTLSQTVATMIDIDALPNVAQQFQVSGVPAFVAVSPGGEEVSRFTGYRDAESFLQWVAHSLDNAEIQWKESLAANEHLEELSIAIQSKDPNKVQEALNTLYELLNTRDPKTLEKCLIVMKEVAQRDSTLLEDGLTHPDLLVRVSTARALGDQAATQDSDPWTVVK